MIGPNVSRDQYHDAVNGVFISTLRCFEITLSPPVLTQIYHNTPLAKQHAVAATVDVA